MPEYRRADSAGATYFFTVVTNFRRPIFQDSRAVQLLRDAIHAVMNNHPFNIDAAVILPDHLHCIWTLPPDDQDFSARWRLIKGRFSHIYLSRLGRESGRSQSRRRQGERSIWQRRFWEHLIRDDDDLQRHMDYVHYNPVMHELAECPHSWPYSSFHRWVDQGAYDQDWGCTCSNTDRTEFNIPEVACDVGEPI